MKNLFFLLFLAFSMSVYSQVAVTTDGASPDNSAMLDVQSTTRGMLIPRLTMDQRNGLTSPAPGLMLLQTVNTPGLYFNSGTTMAPVWMRLGDNNSSWGIAGNGGTNTATNFIGTTDNVPFNFRVNNQKAGKISSDGPVFLGYQSGSSNNAYNCTGIDQAET